MSRIKIHLDRLSEALTKANIPLKRADILELAAQAFGFHNSNEATAAAKRGDLDPPVAMPLGRIAINGETLVVLTDPITTIPFALKTAGERIEISPYSGLVAIPNTANLPYLLTLNSTLNAVEYQAIVTHCEGDTIFSAQTKDDLTKKLGDWCCEWWWEFPDQIKDRYDLQKMSLQEVIDAYFKNHEIDKVEYRTELAAPTETLVPIVATAPKPKSSPNEVHIAVIESPFSHEVVDATSSDELTAKLAAYCRQHWTPRTWQSSYGQGDVEKHEDLSDARVIDIYLDLSGESWTKYIYSIDATPPAMPPRNDANVILQALADAEQNLIKHVDPKRLDLIKASFKELATDLANAEKNERSRAAAKPSTSCSIHVRFDEDRSRTHDCYGKSPLIAWHNLAVFCRDAWKHLPDASLKALDPHQMQDRDVVDLYFAAKPGEKYKLSANFPAPPPAILSEDPLYHFIAAPPGNPEQAKYCLTYLTNGCCEEAHANYALLEILAIPFADDYEYPLTKIEEKFIGEEYASSSFGFDGLMSYSIFFNNRKFICVDFEVMYDRTTSDPLAEVKNQADNFSRHLVERLAPFNVEFHVMIEHDSGPDGDRCEIHLLLPFSLAIPHGDFDSWKKFLETKILS